MRIGKILGIEVVVNPYFLLLLGLYTLAGVFLSGLLAFSVVMLHELAHVLAARWYGLKVKEVELLPFGGVARLDSFLEMDPAREIRVALAGPLSNLLLGGVLGLAFGLGYWQHPLVWTCIKINMMIFLFNLLPILPLDGGRVYRALLISRLGIKQATEAAASSGILVTILLGVLGVVGLYKDLVGVDFIITVLFLAYVGTREGNKAMYLFMRYITRKKEELAGLGVLPVEQFAVEGSLPLRKMMRYLIPKRFCIVTVLTGDLVVQGLLTEGDIIEGILNLGLDVPISQLLTD